MIPNVSFHSCYICLKRISVPACLLACILPLLAMLFILVPAMQVLVHVSIHPLLGRPRQLASYVVEIMDERIFTFL